MPLRYDGPVRMKPKNTKRRDANLRLFLRLLISYNDFQQAADIASYILRHKFQEKVERLRGQRRYRIKLLWQALNCAMVIAYCRPFSGNDRRSARHIPDLPPRFLKSLTHAERELHRTAIEERNTLFAHSDSEAWNLRPHLLETSPGSKILVPLHSDARAPFLHEVVERLLDMCIKLRESVFEERMRLEKELADEFPTVVLDDVLPPKLKEKLKTIREQLALKPKGE